MSLPNARAARLIKVIVTETLEGEGTEDSLARIVKRYYEPHGRLLAVMDPAVMIPAGAAHPEDEAVR